jgi:CelD/BcsL family acetyltransferase involved in cellulose biosynthesis
VVGGVSNPLRFSVMFNSITAGDSARLSPGIILMAEIVRLCARRGIASIDLGAGQARYKGLFCSGSQGRIDCFVPYTARGRALAAVYGADNSIRHAFKRSPPLMDALNAARRWTTAATRWLG